MRGLRFLLRLLPRPFRRDYGEELLETAREQWRSQGPRLSGLGRLLFWPRQWWAVLRVAAGLQWPGRVAGEPVWREGGMKRMGEVGQDLRYALRQMARAPGFHGLVILMLGLGIGLNTAAFSAVHALLVRPLPGVERPDRLVRLFRSFPGGLERGANSIPHYRDLREGTRQAFDGVAAWGFVTLSLGSEEGAELVLGQMASADFFDVLGVEAVLGRTFVPEEGMSVGAHPVVVLSWGYWQDRFGGDPGIVGRELRINGRGFEVVGVAPRRFAGPTKLQAPALWVPLSMQPLLLPGWGDVHESRNTNFLNAIARLRPGTTVEAARASVEALLAGLRERHPDVYEGTGIRILPQDEVGLAADYGRYGVVLLAVVGLLLLVACVNVANMFLARGEQRRREIDIRLSLGAGRGRILRQLLTESLLLTAAGGVGAVALAGAAVDLLGRIPLPGGPPLDLDLNLPVLLFTLVVALGTGVAFGLAPALRAVRTARRGPMAGMASSRGGQPPRLSGALVVAQTALSVVLILSAAIFLRSLWAATRIDPGLDVDRLVALGLAPGILGYDRASVEELYRGLARRLERHPDVAGVTWADLAPLASGRQATRVSVPGSAVVDDPLTVGYTRIGPHYFATVGIGLRSGRGIKEQDDPEAPPVVVVNAAMAALFWPGQDPLGQTVETQGGKRLTVVGIAQNTSTFDLKGPAQPFMYLALAQDFGPNATVIVRSGGDPERLIPLIRAEVRALDRQVPFRNMRTIRNEVGRILLPTRVTAVALGLFGALGLLLSAAGLYGVVAYTVSRQVREIGIRIALGADPGRVLRSVVGRGLRLTLTGSVLGIVAAAAAAGWVREMVYQERTVDPLAVLVVPLLLTAVAVIASWIPARRAAAVDPVRALKTE